MNRIPKIDLIVWLLIYAHYGHFKTKGFFSATHQKIWIIKNLIWLFWTLLLVFVNWETFHPGWFFSGGSHSHQFIQLDKVVTLSLRRLQPYTAVFKSPCDCQHLQFHGHFQSADKSAYLRSFEDHIHKTANHGSATEEFWSSIY